MLFHELFDADKFGLRKSMITRQRNGAQPEFCLHFLASHVNMRRLVVFAVEK